jgi:NADPH-dependent 2,4-dienoyl-CoA reductase/sulfur reductase-like enzyme
MLGEFDYVVLCPGFKPNTREILENSTEKMSNANGVILVNRKQQTSIPDVYAAGDCCSCYS